MNDTTRSTENTDVQTIKIVYATPRDHIDVDTRLYRIESLLNRILRRMRAPLFAKATVGSDDDRKADHGVNTDRYGTPTDKMGIEDRIYRIEVALDGIHKRMTEPLYTEEELDNYTYSAYLEARSEASRSAALAE
jgi:hypothetical protein